MLIEPTTQIFTGDVPLLDVRAEVEFAQGAFPHAVNLPILTDTEREQVGISYKHEGPDAAVELGHHLVSGDAKTTRVAAWQRFIDANPGTLLYCFRGGQRSRIAAEWLHDAGIEIPRIEGGYKAMRRLLVDHFEKLPNLAIIGGRTGVGKTEFLLKLVAARPLSIVDLEGRANHRGSAFGKMPTPQPTQIDFENAVAIDFLKSSVTGHQMTFIEDEGRMVGRVNLPVGLQDRMKASPLLQLECSLAERVDRIYCEYIEDMAVRVASEHGPETGPAVHRDMFLTSVDAIRKRLGGVRHKEIRAIMESAFENSSDTDHKAWIQQLLVNYYDPMYDYQLESKQDRICFRGEQDAVMERCFELLDH